MEEQFLDYKIKMSSDGIVLVKDGCNAMPGACHFGKEWTERNLDEAKRSAVRLFMIANADEFDGALFWRLESRSGAYMEWFTMEKLLKKKNIPIPEGLSCTTENMSIGFKGKII